MCIMCQAQKWHFLIYDLVLWKFLLFCFASVFLLTAACAHSFPFSFDWFRRVLIFIFCLFYFFRYRRSLFDLLCGVCFRMCVSTLWLRCFFSFLLISLFGKLCYLIASIGWFGLNTHQSNICASTCNAHRYEPWCCVRNHGGVIQCCTSYCFVLFCFAFHRSIAR